MKEWRPSIFERTWFTSFVTFLGSIVVLTLVTLKSGSTKDLYGDAAQYLAIGRSLAAGNGYKNLVGPWPTLSDYSRMPVWPALISLGLRVAPWASPEAVSRFTNAFCLSMAGAFCSAFSRRLGLKPIFSLLAGLGVSFSLVLVYLSIGGLSEVSFVMILAAGLTAILSGGRYVYLGALILGMAALVRTNFILLPFVFFALALILRPSRKALIQRGSLVRVLGWCVLALLPAFLWTVRNYLITGRFPLLSTIEGETFYGANNELVANNLEYWGYWVFPDLIPGQVPKLQLAEQMGSDVALNDYYHEKGITWIKTHLRSLPRLELGKFIRAFAPIPWFPLTGSYIVFFYRFLLYVLWFALLPFWWPFMNRTYLLFCLAMFIVHIATTAIYYGVYRFTHCYVEILFIPCIAYGLQQRFKSDPASADVASSARVPPSTQCSVTC